MTLTHFPKFFLPKNHDQVLMKKVWIFFPEMTLTHFPKSDFWNFGWIFFPRMTLTHFPAFGFFFQDSRIGVNNMILKAADVAKVPEPMMEKHQSGKTPFCVDNQLIESKQE